MNLKRVKSIDLVPLKLIYVPRQCQRYFISPFATIAQSHLSILLHTLIVMSVFGLILQPRRGSGCASILISQSPIVCSRKKCVSLRIFVRAHSNQAPESKIN
jgi:hypothetical protein